MKVPFEQHAGWQEQTQAITALTAISDYLDNVAGRLLMHVPCHSTAFMEQIGEMPRCHIGVDFEAIALKVTFNPDYINILKQYVDANPGGTYTFDTEFKPHDIWNHSMLFLKRAVTTSDKKAPLVSTVSREDFMRKVASPFAESQLEKEIVFRADRRSRTTYISVFVPLKRPEKMIIVITPSERGKNREKMYQDFVAYFVSQAQNIYDQVNSMNDIPQ